LNGRFHFERYKYHDATFALLSIHGFDPYHYRGTHELSDRLSKIPNTPSSRRFTPLYTIREVNSRLDE
jgi:hypothetical protein